MKGDIICHAVEVGTYQRRLPNGQVITVKAYKRNGNAAQDDLNRRIESAKYRTQGMIDFDREKVQMFNDWIKEDKAAGKSTELDEQLKRTTLDNLKKYHLKQEQAVRDEENAAISTKDVVRFAATDAYETVQTAVGNLFEEAKFQAQSAAVIVEGTAKNVVDTVRNGWDAVKSFFGGLFKRR